MDARLKTILATLAALAAAAAVAGAAVVYIGLYDLSATDPHLRPTHWLLDTAMRRAIKLRASRIAVPALDDAAKIERGLALFRTHCAQCHGAPGVAPEPFAMGLLPSAANLAHAGREWPPAEIYWVVKHGIKMTGMPAWQFRMSEDDLWAVVAFVHRMPLLSPQEYRDLAARTKEPERHEERAGAKADPKRGEAAILQYACVTCHVIPGIVGANAPVGPPLDRIGAREQIAGALPNTRENMVRFLRSPQSIKPRGAMPDLGVTERDAHDIAAYLETLR